MSYKSDGSFIARKGTAGPSVTQYATVAELITASQGSLEPGYYEVPGVWVTFWNGSTFSPPAPDAVQLDYTVHLPDLVTPETKLLIGPGQKFPALRDFSGTIPDSSFADVTLPDADARGIYSGASRVTQRFGFFADLLILGDVALQFAFSCLSEISGNVSVIDMGESGETEAVNYPYNVDATQLGVRYDSEHGAGANSEASWRMPGRYQVGRKYIVDVRRVSNVVTAYVNGLQLRRAHTLTNATDDAGSITTTPPTGGGSTTVCYDGCGENASVDVLWAQVATESIDPAEYAEPCQWTEDELDWFGRDTYTADAADPDAVVVLRPSASGFDDLAGGVSAWSVNTCTESFLIGDYYWANFEAQRGTAQPNVNTLILGDLTVNMLLFKQGTGASISTATLVSQQASPPTTASSGNVAYRIAFTAATTLEYFCETGSNSNRSVTWTIPAWADGDLREYRIVRNDAGSGNQFVRAYQRLFGGDWTQLTVASVTGGSGGGTGEATVTAPTDGSATSFWCGRTGGDGFAARAINIFSRAINPI